MANVGYRADTSRKSARRGASGLCQKTTVLAFNQFIVVKRSVAHRICFIRMDMRFAPIFSSEYLQSFDIVPNHDHAELVRGFRARKASSY